MKIENLRKTEKGFTLIELLVVIAIIGALMGAVVIAINPATRLAEARDAGKKNDIGQVASAMEAYFTRNQKYPATTTDLKDSDDLKRAPADVVIVPATKDATDHAAYVALEADKTTSCYTTTLVNAFFCYRTDTGVSALVCKASGVPSATCQ